MATQTFQPDRVRLCIEGTVAVYREAIRAEVFDLGHLAVDEAEHIVAVAGEDERQYCVRDRESFFETLCRCIDEFLLDDDGGYYQMRVYLSSHERSDAVLEAWFQVTRPGATTRGTWFRHLVAGIDDGRVYADMGDVAEVAVASD